MEETMPSLFTSLRSSSHKPLSSKKELEWLIMQDRFIQIHTDDYIGGKTKCVKMNETLNQWKAL